MLTILPCYQFGVASRLVAAANSLKVATRNLCRTKTTCSNRLYWLCATSLKSITSLARFMTRDVLLFVVAALVVGLMLFIIVNIDRLW